MVENHEEILKTVKLQILHKYSIPKFLKNAFRQVGSRYRDCSARGSRFPPAARGSRGRRWFRVLRSADRPRGGAAAPAQLRSEPAIRAGSSQPRGGAGLELKFAVLEQFPSTESCHR